MTGSKLHAFALAGIVFAGACVSIARAAAPGPVAATRAGDVEGVRIGGLAVFKGLPYAAPPVGALRWRAPQPAAGWKGVRKADAFGDACIQDAAAAEQAGAGAPGPIGEDCLTLNVWTPDAKAPGARPVMVWIHGGGLVFGAGSQAAYDGAALARRGAVVVTLNYRMGALGFFDHPALAAEAGGVANFGLLDQIAALRWVRDNIAAFGGDPGNVTVFGESAGAQSVLALFASPKARGLFRRGIAQSPYGIPGNTRAKARTVAGNVASALGLDGARATAAQLRAIPAARFGAGLKGQDLSLSPGFVLGDAVLPEAILAAFQNRREAQLPLIVGSNSDEATVATAFGIDPAKLVERLGAGRILLKPLYPGVSDKAQLGREAVRDVVFTAFARRIAYLHSRSAPTWRYYFSHVSPGLQPPPAGAGHGAEIVYALDSGEACGCLAAPFEAQDRDVARAMGNYWFAFARDGVPQATGRAAWPKDGTRRPQVMEFGAVPMPRSDFMRARLDVLIGTLKSAGWLLDRRQ